MRHSLVIPLFLLAACSTTTLDPLNDYESVQPATMMSAPEARRAAASGDASVRGRYLVELLGCSTCHTGGALVGQPRMDHWLAGSRIGIAYSNPLETDNPGVLFPSNLTSDKETGLGRWTDAEIAGAIRSGTGRHGRMAAPVMPWPAYARLSDPDVGAIVAYLRSLQPVANRVPASVAPGTATNEQYVHFGVYRSRR
ncbi:MAG: c-type cytochrome [Gammaproteobacteria bacterium]|nr:c-type cytochrome [Gammaproteobacteria bacterium]NNM20900.1 c-type cytochrome [Gammaproteobacteria bacterium]